ncbi:unnamed protein product, partial [Ceratitis capitata]
ELSNKLTVPTTLSALQRKAPDKTLPGISGENPGRKVAKSGNIMHEHKKMQAMPGQAPHDATPSDRRSNRHRPMECAGGRRAASANCPLHARGKH